MYLADVLRASDGATRARKRAGVMERVFADQPFAPLLVEGNQAGDHGFRCSGLGVRDGLLKGNRTGAGMERNILQAKLLGATRIA